MAEGSDPLFVNFRTGQAMPIADGIVAGSITTNMIADDAITTDKIDDGAVTLEKLNSDVFYGTFSVHRDNVDQTGLNDDATNVIVFTDELFDGDYDIANNRFQPTVPGIYSITLSIFSEITAVDGVSSAQLLKNGSTVASGSFTLAEFIDGLSQLSNLTALIEMNGTTDFIQGGVFLPLGITILSGSTIATFMCGHLVKPL